MVESLMPKAIETVQNILLNEAGKVQKEYKGYIASFGASIIQSGLITAIAFYENTDSQVGDKRRLLMKAILRLIDEDAFNINTPDNQYRLLDCVLSNQDNYRELEDKIINASIAIKLAMRTYEFTE